MPARAGRADRGFDVLDLDIRVGLAVQNAPGPAQVNRFGRHSALADVVADAFELVGVPRLQDGV